MKDENENGLKKAYLLGIDFGMLEESSPRILLMIELYFFIVDAKL